MESEIAKGNKIIFESPFCTGMAKKVLETSYNNLKDYGKLNIMDNYPIMFDIIDNILNDEPKDGRISAFEISYIPALKMHSCTICYLFHTSGFLPVEVHRDHKSRTMAIWMAIIAYINWYINKK